MADLALLLRTTREGTLRDAEAPAKSFEILRDNTQRADCVGMRLSCQRWLGLSHWPNGRECKPKQGGSDGQRKTL